MAIKFLGYIDSAEATANTGKRRLLLGCEASDVSNLPVNVGVSFNGGVTVVPDDWSFAVVKGGKTQVLTGGSWGDLN